MSQIHYNLRPRPLKVPDDYSIDNMVMDLPKCCTDHDKCRKPVYKDKRIPRSHFDKMKTKKKKIFQPRKSSRITSKELIKKKNKERDKNSKSTKSKDKKKKRTFRQFHKNKIDKTPVLYMYNISLKIS